LGAHNEKNFQKVGKKKKGKKPGSNAGQEEGRKTTYRGLAGRGPNPQGTGFSVSLIVGGRKRKRGKK